jgi:hypothetical protein
MRPGGSGNVVAGGSYRAICVKNNWQALSTDSYRLLLMTVFGRHP